jgi:hypothetical protein
LLKGYLLSVKREKKTREKMLHPASITYHSRGSMDQCLKLGYRNGRKDAYDSSMQ